MWDGQALSLLDQLCASRFHSAFVDPIERSPPSFHGRDRQSQEWFTFQKTSLISAHQRTGSPNVASSADPSEKVAEIITFPL